MNKKIKNLLIWLFLITIAFFVRFYNYQYFLYFIYDQGRDAIKLFNMVAGDLTLVGPTSGLAGFFLGPLWYYIGLPGFILSNGSPYGISLWYIFLACLSVPVMALISKKLFANSYKWQLITFCLLAFLPASVNGSIFIWNPLLAIPLIAGTIYSLLQARQSRLFLFYAFLLLGFTLHAEFAYAVFIIPVVFLSVPVIRKKLSILDYLISGFALLITFVPQILFEIKNNFIMTKSLSGAILSDESNISFVKLLSQRPSQLLVSTSDLLFGNSTSAMLITILFLLIIIYGCYRSIKNKSSEWQIISLITVAPYIGFMMWRGNYGNFFSYYLTPHFIPLVLLFSYGLKEIYRNCAKEYKQYINYFAISFVTVMLTFSYQNIYEKNTSKNNFAGIKTVELATVKTLEYFLSDTQNVVILDEGLGVKSTVLTFTPNYLTAQYDFMMQWIANKQGVGIPNTQISESDTFVYVIIEPDREIPEIRFIPWYERVTSGRVRIRKEKVGVLQLETWVKKEVAEANNFLIYPETILEKMCW